MALRATSWLHSLSFVAVVILASCQGLCDLGGCGQPAGGALSVSSAVTTTAYGTQSLAWHSDRTITIQNSGTAAATFQSALFSLADFTFTGGSYPGTGGTCPTSIPGGTSCIISIRFAPSVAGARSGTVSLSFGSSRATQAVEVTLTGTGIASGTYDLTWNGQGYRTDNSGGGGTDGAGLAIQSDGKVVIVGAANQGGGTNHFVIYRYLTDGSADTAFGSGGYLEHAVYGVAADRARKVIIQSDGKIVAGGEAENGDLDFALARYTTGGALDTTYGVAGITSVDFSGNDDAIYGLALQTDGKLVAVGLARVTGQYRIALARFLTNGAIDTTFGTAGKTTTTVQAGSADEASAVAIESDGKIYIAGSSYTGIPTTVLARYATNGVLDATFGTAGISTANQSGSTENYATALTIQPNGRIVIGGKSKVTVGYNFSLGRYLTNGSLDTTFGTAGLALHPASNNDIMASVVVDSDGNILFGGVSDPLQYTVARCDSNGALDSTVGTGGFIHRTIAGSVNHGAQNFVQDSDGRIVLGGIARPGGLFVLTALRFWP